MAQYRIFQEALARLRRMVWVIGLLLALIIGAEMARVCLLLHRITPGLGYLFFAILAITTIIGLIAIIAARRRDSILTAHHLLTDEKSSQKRLARSLNHQIHVCRRIASQSLLSAERKKTMQQGAHDLQRALEHHPLRDDLRRGIDTARERIIQPALFELDQINAKVTAAKVRAVLEDYYQPYFPALAPWIVVYHQFTLVSEIVDIYLPQPSLSEYRRVLRDTWTTLRRGDLLHHGQRYFAGIEAANAPLGEAADELIEAMSIIWMTHCVSQTATLRCKTHHDWSETAGIATLKGRLGECLQSTRDSIARDALPLLKRRLYRYGGLHGRDVRLFADETIQSFIKSMDGVHISANAGLRTAATPPPTAPEAAPQHEAAPVADTGSEEGDREEYHDHHYRHRRRRSRSSFRRFIDKLTGRDFHF